MKTWKEFLNESRTKHTIRMLLEQADSNTSLQMLLEKSGMASSLEVQEYINPRGDSKLQQIHQAYLQLHSTWSKKYQEETGERNSGDISAKFRTEFWNAGNPDYKHGDIIDTKIANEHREKLIDDIKDLKPISAMAYDRMKPFSVADLKRILLPI